MKTVKLIPKYLWQYKFVIAVFFVFSCVFAVVAYLYHTDVAAILYSTLLCAVVAIILIGIHFYRYCKKHSERMRLFEYARYVFCSNDKSVSRLK